MYYTTLTHLNYSMIMQSQLQSSKYCIIALPHMVQSKFNMAANGCLVHSVCT